MNEKNAITPLSPSCRDRLGLTYEMLGNAAKLKPNVVMPNFFQEKLEGCPFHLQVYPRGPAPVIYLVDETLVESDAENFFSEPTDRPGVTLLPSRGGAEVSCPSQALDQAVWAVLERVTGSFVQWFEDLKSRAHDLAPEEPEQPWDPAYRQPSRSTKTSTAGTKPFFDAGHRSTL